MVDSNKGTCFGLRPSPPPAFFYLCELASKHIHPVQTPSSNGEGVSPRPQPYCLLGAAAVGVNLVSHVRPTQKNTLNCLKMNAACLAKQNYFEGQPKTKNKTKKKLKNPKQNLAPAHAHAHARARVRMYACTCMRAHTRTQPGDREVLE